MVGLRDVREATGIAIDGLIVLKRHKKCVTLGLQLVSHARLLNGTALDHDLGVRLCTACSLHHLSLRRGFFLLNRLSLLGGDKVPIFLTIRPFFLCCLLREFIPRFVIVEHWGDIPFQFRLLNFFGVFCSVLFVKDLTFLFIFHPIDINFVPDWRQWNFGSCLGGFCAQTLILA